MHIIVYIQLSEKLYIVWQNVAIPKEDYESDTVAEMTKLLQSAKNSFPDLFITTT